MKKFLKENALKLTVFGNLFSLLGAVYFFALLFLILLIYINGASLKTNFAYLLLMIYITMGYLIVSSIVVLGFVLELLFRHRIKNAFFKENKVYNTLFYIGLSLTLFSYIFIYSYFFVSH